MPGDEITVSLKYTEFLIPTEGIYQLTYPTVVGPRYSNKTESTTNTPFHRQGEESSYDFDIDIDLSAGLPIQDISCKTHKIDIKYSTTDKAIIKLDASENKGGNRDFVLQYQLAGDSITSGLMLYEHEDENFFLMMVQPPKRIIKTDIPPREYIFINDVSGSMKGYPMDISKKIMRNLVSNLRPEDRFNVLVFAGTSGWMSDESIPANAENIEKAVHFIDNQNGGGGTEILHALKKALSFPRKFEEMSRSFVVVTDGYVNVEKEVFDLIRNNNDKANTFVFGIGSSVNRYILEGMAHVGMGEPFIVLDNNEANAKAEKFREYITNPVLTQIKLNFSNFEVYDVEPITIPDVFAERPIIIYGKYKGKAEGIAKLKAYSGRKRWDAKIDISNFKPDDKNAALRYLWARKSIQMLDDYGSLNSGIDQEKVTQLGLKYNLLTNYTSFIAIEEIPTNNAELKIVKQAVPLPLNVSNSAVGFELELEEVMDIEMISFYDKIKIITDLPDNQKDELQKYIEEMLMPKLDDCFMNANNIERIVVTIGVDGTVKIIKLDGSTIKSELKADVEKIIQKWNFKDFNLNNEVEFEIEF
jgi:Ca-activated chloride channel family protein